ncbi:DNA primase family protein, partial [Falsiroseomonas sp. HC035]|uniref:DNA primase family protein n=1 Tax=Falsiroseomonas sp. HC035 TaxID=3390999 RepID=UPI003D31573A
LSWTDLAALLTRHEIGAKEGSCVVPATFTGTRRHKNDAARIDVVMLDSDAGATLQEITQAIKAHGWAAVVSSTHSHLTTRTKAKRGNWEEFCSDHSNRSDAASAFLRAKGMHPRIAAGAKVLEETGDHIVFEHLPCPKFRIAIPLLQPWLAVSFVDQQAANAAWKKSIEALAAALRLDHDQACTDTSRLFYLPRRAAHAPPAEIAVLQGTPCDLFALPKAERDWSSQGSGALRQRSRSHEVETAGGFTDPDTGEVHDLVAWARRFGHRFQVVAALQARRPTALTSKVADTVKHHIRCPNEDAHTQPGSDGATFATNASESRNKGFVIHCRHAHCNGKDRLFLLRRMLEQRWICAADLTHPDFIRIDSPAPCDGSSPAGAAQPDKILWLEIGSDTEIAARVTDDLVRRLGRIVFADGEIWRYNGRTWEVIRSETLWLAVYRYDGARFKTATGDDSNVRLGKGRVESILVCMRPALSDHLFFANAAIGINCASGFIQFDKDGTPALKPHHPDHRQRHILPGVWPCAWSDLRKQSSLLTRLLDGCFKGDEDQRAKVDLLAEVAGIAALGRATCIAQPKALVLKGPTAENGKSQILNLLRSLLPTTAVASISPSRFDDRTFTCHLAGKLLNAPDELASSDAIASEVFKQIITGEPMTVRDVHKSAFEFRPVAQHVYATNNLPTFRGGMDRGVRRRIMVLVFNRVIPRDERVANIGSRVGEEEADYLLDWVVRGASRILQRQAFTEPASSLAGLRDWMFSSDPVLAWLESDEVEFSGNGLVPETRTSIAYHKFKRWALNEGYDQRCQIPALNGFSQRVVAAGKGISKKRSAFAPFFVGLACIGRDAD